MTIIYFLLILGITVFIHESGHFIFAKRAGIYVYEFSIGMGPLIKKFKRKNDETTYAIRLFPIGGYVQMAGESVEDDTSVPNDKKMQNKTWTQRFMTIVAGVLFNFIMAIIILFFVALFNGAPSKETYIGAIDKNLPASKTALVQGDLILEFNGDKVSSSDDLMLDLQINMGKPLAIKVKHENGNIETINITPKEITTGEDVSYKYGFGIQTDIEKGLFVSVKYAFTKTYTLTKQMVEVIGYLFTGKLGLENLAGPIGIYNVVGETAKAGISNLFYLLAYISINVGFINLIPFPAFDGSRLLFLIIEKIKGKPISLKVENLIHTIGFVILMILMVFITYNDIVRLFF